MLTGNLVRARVSKGVVKPYYIDPADEGWAEAAGQLAAVFESSLGKPRDELDDAVEELVVAMARPIVARGLAKLLTDRCEFETAGGADPSEVRRTVFEEAARIGWHTEELKVQSSEFKEGDLEGRSTDAEGRSTDAEGRSTGPAIARAALTAEARRTAAVGSAAQRLGMAPAEVEAGLYADLKGAQRLVKFAPLSAERLVDRYNVALAQAVLLKAVRMTVRVTAESPARYRQLFRHLKFHRLLYQVAGDSKSGYVLTIDGPLSLFRQTTKYGVQMALFLPALLLCPLWTLEAAVQWGVPPRDCKFLLSADDGLKSHAPDTGRYVPDEIKAFAAAFAGKVPDWSISEETGLIPLAGEGVCVPDFRFVHRKTGTEVLMEILGFWNRAGVARRLELQKLAGMERMILAVSAELAVDEAELELLPAAVYRFRSMPLVREVTEILKGFV